jgi:hypothetical protein
MTNSLADMGHERPSSEMFSMCYKGVFTRHTIWELRLPEWLTSLAWLDWITRAFCTRPWIRCGQSARHVCRLARVLRFAIGDLSASSCPKILACPCDPRSRTLKAPMAHSIRGKAHGKTSRSCSRTHQNTEILSMHTQIL